MGSPPATVSTGLDQRGKADCRRSHLRSRSWPRSTALSRTDARRIAVRAQLLTKERPTDLVETVRRLSLLQLEPDQRDRAERRPGAVEPAGVVVLAAASCGTPSTSRR